MEVWWVKLLFLESFQMVTLENAVFKCLFFKTTQLKKLIFSLIQLTNLLPGSLHANLSLFYFGSSF